MAFIKKAEFVASTANFEPLNIILGANYKENRPPRNEDWQQIFFVINDKEAISNETGKIVQIADLPKEFTYLGVYAHQVIVSDKELKAVLTGQFDRKIWWFFSMEKAIGVFKESRNEESRTKLLQLMTGNRPLIKNRNSFAIYVDRHFKRIY